MPKKKKTPPAPSNPPPKPAPLSGPVVASVAADTQDFKTEDEISNLLYIRKQRSFKGATLAEYSSGIRLLWHNIMNDGDGSQMLGACLIWMLLQLQACYDEAAKTIKESEMAWNVAKHSFLRIVDQKTICRVKVFTWVEKLKRRELDEIVIMAQEVLAEADREEVETETTIIPSTGQQEGITTAPGN